MQISILKEDASAVLTVSVPGDPKSPYIARDDHPNFKVMVAAVVSGDTVDLPALFDVADTVALKFQRLSDRVTVDEGQIKFDGVVVDSTLSQQILDVIQEGATDASYVGLVKFMENVYTNPDGPTATRIFDWLRAQNGLTITDEGMIVGYKKVNSDTTYGYRSIGTGSEPVTVRFADGTEEVFKGSIPNPIGATVEMPRDLVNNNANQTCSVGLHVAAWGYTGVGAWSGNILEIHVNPRDVVSVPVDYNGQKVRVCRYYIAGVATAKYGQAVKTADEAPRERGTQSAPTTAEDLDLALAPLREATANANGEGLYVGLRVKDIDGDEGTVQQRADGFYVLYDADRYPDMHIDPSDLGDDGFWTVIEETAQPVHPALVPVVHVGTVSGRISFGGSASQLSGSSRKHGKGGATSQAAKGRGKNPAQDASGKFSTGRPGSRRDSGGRFA